MSAARMERTVSDLQASRLFAALAHPLRSDILEVFGEQVLSPSELSVRLGQPLHDIVYHVRRLVELGCLELVEREIRGNSVVGFFRRPNLPYFEHDICEELGPAPWRNLTDMTIGMIFRDALSANAAADLTLHDLAVDLDEEGWRELDDCVSEFLEDLQQISENAAARIADESSTDQGRPLAFSLLKFRAAS